MQRAILDGGPIVASFDTFDDFHHFDGTGVYKKRSGARRRGAHALVLFGWGEDSNGKFWWAKNSYGEAWPKPTVDKDGGKGIFKFARGSNECNIEESGASWVYVMPKNTLRGSRASHVKELLGLGPHGLRDGTSPAMCPRVLRGADAMNEEESCLRVIETDEDISQPGSTSSCTVENICQKRVKYTLATTSSMNNCGMYMAGSMSIQPGEKHTNDGYTSCCVLTEAHDSNVLKPEPGTCLETAADPTRFSGFTKNDCVMKNTCDYDIKIFTGAPIDMQRSFTLTANRGWTTLNGVDASLCVAKTMRSLKST